MLGNCYRQDGTLCGGTNQITVLLFLRLRVSILCGHNQDNQETAPVSMRDQLVWDSALIHPQVTGVSWRQDGEGSWLLSQGACAVNRRSTGSHLNSHASWPPASYVAVRRPSKSLHILPCKMDLTWFTSQSCFET